MTQLPALAALALLTWPASSALDGADLTERAAAARAAADAPALGLVVVRPGEKPIIAVDGVRQAGGNATVTPRDQWHWGSVTKSMTATLVARLVDKGTVSWDDALGDLLFEHAPEMRLEYGEATFRHLLSHHAGLQANIPITSFGRFGQTPEDPIADRLEWVRLALAQKPRGPLEATYEYSNSGFIVVGAMLEAATGETWEALMRREVFEPLGMKHAGFGPPQGDQPRGHVRESGGDMPVPASADNPAALGPAGRVHTSLADMARYLTAHATRDTEFLTAESWETLHTVPFGNGYAMGWVETSPGVRWHNGSNTMWYAEVTFDLETGTAAAVAVNDGDIAAVSPAVRELLRELMQGEEASAK